MEILTAALYVAPVISIAAAAVVGVALVVFFGRDVYDLAHHA